MSERTKTATGRLMWWEQLGTRSWGLGVAADILSLEERLAKLEQKQTSVGVAGMDPAADRKSVATHGACASPCSQPFDSAPITLDAAPAARASVGRPRTDKADLPTRAGTGNTPVADSATTAEPAAWIPVTERLPDHGGSVVCRTKQRELKFGRVMTVTEYKGGAKAVSHHWRGCPDGPLEVTHWTPIPAPPPDFAPSPPENAEPVAWGVEQPNGEFPVLAFKKQRAEDYATASDRVIPLYRKPTLTDAEREAIERGYCSLMGVQDMSAECTRWDAEAAATLRGLLERMK